MTEELLLPFAEIKLTRSEWSCLKELAQNNVMVTGKNESVLKRLFRHKFAYPVWQQDVNAPRLAAIYPRGIDYLAYLDASRTQKRAEWIRYIITTAIAVAAFVKSFFF